MILGVLEELRDEVHGLIEKVDQQSAEISALREKVHPTRETFTLRDLAELPEAPALKTLFNWRRISPQKLPGHGKPDGYARDGQAAWLRETVEAWRRELATSPFGNPRGRAAQKAKMEGVA